MEHKKNLTHLRKSIANVCAAVLRTTDAQNGKLIFYIIFNVRSARALKFASCRGRKSIISKAVGRFKLLTDVANEQAAAPNIKEIATLIWAKNKIRI